MTVFINIMDLVGIGLLAAFIPACVGYVLLSHYLAKLRRWRKS